MSTTPHPSERQDREGAEGETRQSARIDTGNAATAPFAAAALVDGSRVATTFRKRARFDSGRLGTGILATLGARFGAGIGPRVASHRRLCKLLELGERSDEPVAVDVARDTGDSAGERVLPDDRAGPGRGH